MKTFKADIIDFPNKNETILAILEGMKTAKKNYSYWTQEEIHLSYAPINFLEIHIAQELSKLNNTPEVFIDSTVSDILKCSLNKSIKYNKFMENHNIKQDTVSITLDKRISHIEKGDAISKVIINVHNGLKNILTEHLYSFEQICKMLQREKKADSSLDFGIFSFSMDISWNSRKDIEERIIELKETFKTVINKYENLKLTYQGGDIIKIENIGQWCVGCFVIEPTY